MERTLEALHSIRRDVAHAARSLAKDRAFTLVCVISLGIGMGAFVAVALLAGLPAARRTTSVQPMVAIRSEEAAQR